MFEELLRLLGRSPLGARVAKIAAYLGRLREIRVYVAAAPGRGHQASAVNAMQWLLDQGYRGDITVVFDDSPQPDIGDTGPKLKELRPSLNADGTGVLMSADGRSRIAFVKKSVFTTSMTGRVPFGLVSGIDSIHKDNLADVLNAAHVVSVSPYQFQIPSGLWIAKTPGFLDFDKHLDYLGLGHLSRDGLTFRSDLGFCCSATEPTFDDWAALRRQDERKAKALQGILMAARHQAINLCPVYGIGLNSAGQVATLGAHKTQHEILFNLVTAIRYTQDNGIQHTYRGTVVLMLAKFEPSEYEKFDALLAAHGETNHVTRFGYKFYNPKSYLAELASNKRKVFVIDMGALPQLFFNHVYARATLPSIMEGASTANLALCFGKPHLRLTQRYPLGAQHGRITKACEAARDALLANVRPSDLEGVPSAARAVGELIIESFSRGTDMARYFSECGAFYSDVRNDKLLNGLIGLSNALEKPADELAAKLEKRASGRAPLESKRVVAPRASLESKRVVAPRPSFKDVRKQLEAQKKAAEDPKGAAQKKAPPEDSNTGGK